MATQWKDADGKWCYATFYRWFGKRFVNVYRYDYGWDDDWSFVGVPVRKNAKKSDAETSELSPLELVSEIEEQLRNLKELLK